MNIQLDPISRYLNITYRVPKSAPAEVRVQCSWSHTGTNHWRPAKVTPRISETALGLATDEDWREWAEHGRVTEHRAAGLQRTVVFQPYPAAQRDGKVDLEFRVELQTRDGVSLSTQQCPVQADNSDVVCIEDFSRVIQRDLVTSATEAQPGRWTWSAESGLCGKPDRHALPQLTVPLDLRGWYAVFVRNDPKRGEIRLRLTGDERADDMRFRRPGEETLWRWCRMDRQHLVIKPPHSYRGHALAHLASVRFVPLSDALLRKLEAPFRGRADKILAGYWEPYSWAFYENVQETLQHREPLVAYREARVEIVDTQLGRIGMKAVFESRTTDQLLHSTVGDPEVGDPSPTTDNVGRMQQFTNTLETEIRHAEELGLNLFANFGAANAYPGTPLQGDFPQQHPEWMRGHAVRYEVPEVRAYVLGLYREALEIGAKGISIDYCRYPDCLDSAETGNTFMRELRALANEFATARKQPVPILARFPAKGVHLWERFDYVAWAREGLVDYLCPSNIQGRHVHFDIAQYVEAVRGTHCKLLPCVDGLPWGAPTPGPFLWRVRQLYEAGADGIYMYQSDYRIFRIPDRRCVRIIPSTGAVRRWWARDAATRRQCSKGIYLNPPLGPDRAWGPYERIRVWLEGIEMGAVELHLDGKLISRYDAPPYILGTEECDSDNVIPPGDHQLLVRARDGDGWLERTFAIRGAE